MGYFLSNYRGFEGKASTCTPEKRSASFMLSAKTLKPNRMNTLNRWTALSDSLKAHAVKVCLVRTLVGVMLLHGGASDNGVISLSNFINHA